MMDLQLINTEVLKKPTGQKNTPDFFGGFACSEIEIIYGVIKDELYNVPTQ